MFAQPAGIPAAMHSMFNEAALNCRIAGLQQHIHATMLTMIEVALQIASTAGKLHISCRDLCWKTVNHDLFVAAGFLHISMLSQAGLTNSLAGRAASSPIKTVYTPAKKKQARQGTNGSKTFKHQS